MHIERFRPERAMGNESMHIRARAISYCRGQGVEVGPGSWPLRPPGPQHVTVDVEGCPTFVPIGVRVTEIPDGWADYVYSSHCLEHIPDWRGALSEWLRWLRRGGVLFLYLPHPSYDPWSRVWHFQHHHDFSARMIVEALRERGAMIADWTEGPDSFDSFRVLAVHR